MKHIKLHILVILLLASLLAAKCDCANNPNSKSGKEKEKKDKRVDMRKQKEFIQQALIKKLGLDKLEELQEKKERGEKPQKRKKLPTEQEKQRKLTQLVEEEKDLVSKAYVALDQFEQDIKPLQSGDESSDLPVPIDRRFMKDLIKDCKDDPEYTNASLDSLQKFQTALDKFQQELPTLRDKKPSIKEFFNVLLDSAGINIEEAKELFGPELFNREEAQEAEQMLSEPVSPDQLPPHYI